MADTGREEGHTRREKFQLVAPRYFSFDFTCIGVADDVMVVPRVVKCVGGMRVEMESEEDWAVLVADGGAAIQALPHRSYAGEDRDNLLMEERSDDPKSEGLMENAH